MLLIFIYVLLDFNEPFNPPGVKRINPDFKADPEATATIVSMGFTPMQAAKALEATVRVFLPFFNH